MHPKDGGEVVSWAATARGTWFHSNKIIILIQLSLSNLYKSAQLVAQCQSTGDSFKSVVYCVCSVPSRVPHTLGAQHMLAE